MNYLMVYVPAKNLEHSILFYESLDFVKSADEVDGNGKRCVRLKHLEFPQVIFNLNYFSSFNQLPKAISPDEVSFTFVVEDPWNWLTKLENVNALIERKIIEPWGMWIYFRDPNHNLICITSRDIW